MLEPEIFGEGSYQCQKLDRNPEFGGPFHRPTFHPLNVISTARAAVDHFNPNKSASGYRVSQRSRSSIVASFYDFPAPTIGRETWCRVPHGFAELDFGVANHG